MKFLEVTVTGVVPQTRVSDALEAAENILRNEWASAGNPGTLAGWAGLTSINAHDAHGKMGCCLDLNYQRNPFIATRTYAASGVPTYGGEDGTSGIRPSFRQRAVEACDRAVRWMAGSTDLSIQADLAMARQNESSENIHRRFKAASDALVRYLTIAFNPAGPRDIARPVIANIDSMSLYDILSTIHAGGPGELRADTDIALDLANAAGIILPLPPVTVAMLPRLIVDSLPPPVADPWRQILIDYEAVRIPMAFGRPSTAPAKTRNPVYGFLDLGERLVVALRGAGLDWGACDLGNQQSGDMMHFQIGPRTP